MRQSFSQIKGKVFRYVLLDILIRILISLPALAIIAIPVLSSISLAKASPASFLVMFYGLMFAYMLAFFYVMAALLLYSFFTQFWVYGFLLDGLGVMDSLKQSFRMVRARPLDILISDLVMMVLSWIASVPMMAFYMMAYVALIFLEVLFILMPLAGLGLLLIGGLACVLASIFFTVLVEMLQVPMLYLLWKEFKR
jgi:hypothetical protein